MSWSPVADYRGRVVIVTGAASGIGRALAIELVTRGASVTLADRDGSGLEIAAAMADPTGTQVRTRVVDVTDAQAVAALVAEVTGPAGRLHAFFHLAGIAVWAEARDTTPADWRALIDVNLLGTVHVVHAVYPRMVQQGSGHLVLTGSLAGLGPSPGMAAYAAVKHGVVGLATSLRAEGAGLGVRVSVACPGPVVTPLLAASPVHRFDRARLEAQMAGKGQTPQDCAREILAGVSRNRAIIVTGSRSRVAWCFARLAPTATIALTARRIRRLRGSLPGALTRSPSRR